MAMKIWFRKAAVVLITMLTLGMYVPPIAVIPEVDENKDEITSKTALNDDTQTTIPLGMDMSEQRISPHLPQQTVEDELIDILTKKAREQAITKLGPKIMDQVDQEFNESILPAIDEVLQTFLTDSDEGELPYYGITEHPAGGIGEKIFHVYDVRTNQDLARFHVRRDNRPQEGYWFNFHYHLSKDNFETHHEIGEIYWDKNTPPRWMA